MAPQEGYTRIEVNHPRRPAAVQRSTSHSLRRDSYIAQNSSQAAPTDRTVPIPAASRSHALSLSSDGISPKNTSHNRDERKRDPIDPTHSVDEQNTSDDSTSTQTLESSQDFRPVEFGHRSPSPRTRETEDRVRRFLLNEAPPISQELQDRLRAIAGKGDNVPRRHRSWSKRKISGHRKHESGTKEQEKVKETNTSHDENGKDIQSAQVAKRAPRPKPITIQSSTSQALVPGQSDRLNRPLPKIPEQEPQLTPRSRPLIPDEPISAPPETPMPMEEKVKIRPLPLPTGKSVIARPKGILKPSSGGKRASGFGFWMVIVALCITGMLSALEATVLSTALPTIVSDLEGGDLYMWAVNAYFLSSTVFQPLYAQTANVFGHRWLTLGAVFLFAGGSAICGTAVSMEMLVGGRAIQGIGGGGVTILMNLIVADLIEPRKRGNFMALIFVMLTVGNGVGPFIGGYIVQTIDWRWVFWLNLPAATLSFILLFFFLKQGSQKRQAVSGFKRLDYVGNAIFIGSMTAFMFAICYGGAGYAWLDWHAIVPLALGGIGFVLFILYESSDYCKEPVIPLRLFGNRTSAAALVISFLHSLVTIWAIYFLPVFFQGVLGSSPSWAGVQILPTVLVIVPVSMISGKLLVWFGHYRPLHFAGFALITAGLGMFTLLDADSSIAMWIGFQILNAAGGGIVVSALLPAVQAGLTEEDVDDAVAAWGFIRNFGIMWGVAIPAALFNNEVNIFAKNQIADSKVQLDILGGRAYELATAAFLETLSSTTAQQVKSALANSLQVVWYVATGIAGFAIFLVLFEADIPLRRAPVAPAVPRVKVRVTPEPDLEAYGAIIDEKHSQVQLKDGPKVAVQVQPVARRLASRNNPTPHRAELGTAGESSASPSSLTTPPEFNTPTTVRSPWHLKNSWTPWGSERRPLQHEDWYGSMEKEVVVGGGGPAATTVEEREIRSGAVSPEEGSILVGLGSPPKELHEAQALGLAAVCAAAAPSVDGRLAPPTEGSSRMAKPKSTTGSEFGRRVTRLLEQIPRDLEEELSQFGEWESSRRSNSTFNF